MWIEFLEGLAWFWDITGNVFFWIYMGMIILCALFMGWMITVLAMIIPLMTVGVVILGITTLVCRWLNYQFGRPPDPPKVPLPPIL